MATRMLIDATHPEETRVVVVRGNRLEEFDFESANKKQLKGNIYLAKVTRVEPSLQAAFVEYGGNRHGFLAFSEIHPDYYQIPVADRQALLEEEAAAHADEDEDDDEDEGAEGEGAAEASSDDEDGDDDGLIEEVEVDTETELVGADDDDDDDQNGGDDEDDDSRMAADAEFEDPILEGMPADGDAPDTEAPAPAAAKPKEDAAEAPAETEAEAVIEMPADAEAPEAVQAETAQADAAQAEEPQAEAPQAETTEAEPAEAEPVEARTDDAAQTEETTAFDPMPVFPAGDDEDGESATADETAAEQPARPRFRPRRSYKIQEVIKRRQIMLVQVVKEERGNKGAALTTYLSLAGRYCVLMPNSPRGGGISRKIQNPADRKRLKSITSELEVPKGMSVIMRTAGLNRSKPEIKRDYEYLLRMWDSVRELTLKSAAPALVYEEGNLIKRAIRDLYSKDIDEIQVDGEEGYRQAKDFMRMLIPSHAKHVQLYRDRVPLFHRAQIENQLDQMFNPTVHLRSGGYIVINPTEALVSIDVNSGRATREHNIEETATKTNLEAAEEIARQLRLRDLAGLVVVDFIDMEDQRNARAVERKMKDCLKSDRARIQIGRISPFGLLEMSRQRLRPSLLEASTVTCPHCRGIGLVRSTESTALHVLRGIEDEGMRERASKIAVKVPEAIALYIFNHKREALRSLEERYDFKIYIEIDESLIAPEFRIERLANRSTPVPEAVLAIRSGTFPMPDLEDEDPVEDDVEAEDAEAESEGATEGSGDAENGDGSKRRRRRRRRRGKDKENGEGAQEAAEGDAESESEAGGAEGEDGSDGDAETDADNGETGEDGNRRRRRRGRRGGRRRRTDGDEAAASGTDADAEAEAEDPTVLVTHIPIIDEGDALTADAIEAALSAARVDDAPVAAEAVAAEVDVAETVAEAPAPEPVPEAPAEPPLDIPAAEPAMAKESPSPEPAATADTLFPETVSPEVEADGAAAPAEEEPVNKPVETIVAGTAPATEAPRAPRRGWWQRRFDS
ncbi:Rne/Rng family ribonuclease [Zavarzinia compransoris]|uniref:Rne/Rng family ribonuclease n=1 Tax=Zavarzinia marina TaxID=2911065 RepID=UPI001F2D08CB|nr:ribonuclease E/G [Zavarzinia marina]MCF4164509.1 Rne/Rng family ribonuclease [Zavarzinia marina]